jgi:nucleotide-binding universal stress UspA family protein
MINRMKPIAVLMDFTPMCHKAMEYASFIADSTSAELILVHVHSSTDEAGIDDLNSQADQYLGMVPKNVRTSKHLAAGPFYNQIPKIINELNVDLMVVPTHGKKGIMQNLFGSNILKLVKAIKAPALVVQEDSRSSDASFREILLSLEGHPEFVDKSTQAAGLAKAFGSKVILYSVKTDVRGMSEEELENMTLARELLEALDIPFSEVRDKPKIFSAGYAKHILNYANEHDVSVLTILAVQLEDTMSISNSDNESILLNEMNLPVLCMS